MPYLYIETARERLCRSGRMMLGGLCNGTVVPSALKAVREKNPQQSVKTVFPEQSTDAVIYVTVVVIFYAAIILILVGTNMHRFRRQAARGAAGDAQSAPPKHHVVVKLDHNEKTYRTSAPPEDVKSEVENQDYEGCIV